MTDFRSVVVAIPCHDHRVQIETAHSLLEASAAFASRKTNMGLMYYSGCSIVSKARNTLIRQFLDSTATDLVFLDSDIAFRGEDLARMVHWGNDFDVVVACYRQKQDALEYRVKPVRSATDNRMQPHDNGYLVEMERAGTGLMVIRRPVIEELVRHVKFYRGSDGLSYPALFDFALTDEGYIGEDYLFCDRARAAGFRIWADINAVVSHHGHKEYTGCFGSDIVAQEYNLTRPTKAAEK